MCVSHKQERFSWLLGWEFNINQKVSWHWLHGQHWPDSHSWRFPGEKWGLHPAAKQMVGCPCTIIQAGQGLSCSPALLQHHSLEF